jgi:hypothetical protein
MKDDESIPKMFYRLQVIINDLKSLDEKVKDEDFSYKFLMCLSKRFKTLRTIIFRGGLKDVSPNEVLGDVMIEDQYNDDDDGVVMEKDKKKSVAFKASTSSSKNKSKGKAKKKDSNDKECSNDDSDDEALTLFVCKFGKMMKKDYHTRKRRDHSRNEAYARLCYKCKSPDHIMADCPYNNDNEDNEKKKSKKEKKEKKMSFKKKKGGSYIVTWDSDASTADDSSDDDKASKKKALASIAINNKPLLFDTSPCFIARGYKVKYNESENDDSESENSSDDKFSNEQLMNMLEQADSVIKKKNKKCKRSLMLLSNHLMSSMLLMRGKRKPMRSLAKLAPSLKKLTPYFLNKIRK